MDQAEIREKVFAYMNSTEGNCPFCGEQTEGDSFDTEGKYVAQNIWCNHCEEDWRIAFKIETVIHDGVTYSREEAFREKALQHLTVIGKFLAGQTISEFSKEHPDAVQAPFDLKAAVTSMGVLQDLIRRF